MDISNNLFDDMYRRTNLNGYTEDKLPNDREKTAIKESFYYMLPLILNEMTQRQRDVISLYYGYNNTQDDIARTLRINQSNVSVHLSNALAVVDKYFLIIYKSTLWGLRYEKGKR